MEPYISINKLAEYSQANATRRRQIIRSLKEDVDFKKNYYQSVRAFLPKYFESNYDENLIKDFISEIKKKDCNSSWTETDKENSVLALETLYFSELPDLTDYLFVGNEIKTDSIVLAGLNVRVKPDIYLKHKITGKYGAIKFHLAKTVQNRLNLNAMQCAATIVKYALLQEGYTLQEIDTNACISVDVFEGNYAASPSSYKRTMDSVTANCEEIYHRWDAV